LSARVFPVLPGNRAVTRSTIYKTSVVEAVSGREDRTSWASAPRYRWSYSFGGLRSWVNVTGSWGTLSEIATVQMFIDYHYASGDSFHITDPYDDSTDRTVRFVEDSVTLTRLASGVWSCSFDLISVI
jgi:hypothetical protein